MQRLRLLPLLLLLSATACAQYVDTTGAAANLPAGMQGHMFRHQLGLVSTLFLPRNTPWRDDSLTCETRSFGAPIVGIEFALRRTPTWLFGISLGTTQVHTDAIRVRSTSISNNTEWTVYGERMRLTQRFSTLGVTAAYEPWHYPRRRKVGMTLQLGGGLYYMHFAEQRFVIANGSADAMNYSGRTFYTYDSNADKQELGRSTGHGISAQLWVRPELHLGRRFALFLDLGAVFATAFNAEGSTYTSSSGTTLSILPRRVHLHRIMLRSGFAVYF